MKLNLSKINTNELIHFTPPPLPLKGGGEGVMSLYLLPLY